MKGRIAVRVRRSVIVLTIIGVTVPPFGVEREYVDRVRLTESEEALVLKMARNRGIGEHQDLQHVSHPVPGNRRAWSGSSLGEGFLPATGRGKTLGICRGASG